MNVKYATNGTLYSGEKGKELPDSSPDFTNKLIFEDLIKTHPALDTNEKELKLFIYRNPKIKNKEVCEAVGIEPYQYSRIIKKIADKLSV